MSVVAVSRLDVGIARHTATHLGGPERAGLADDQLVAEPLMVPLAVVVCHERIEGAEQPTFSEEDGAVETLLADGAHKSFRVGGAAGRGAR
jgi:hypothetical protein